MKVKTKDFQILKGEHEFEFPVGITVIQGKTGSGKTTLFYAIDDCLTNPSGVDDVINWDAKSASVTIENKKTAAIIGLSGDSLTINTVDNSTNTLSDGGNSQFDACIYSKIDLIIDGDGMLNVNGNYKEGIATNNANITINMGRITVKAEEDGINAGGDKSCNNFS